MITMIFPPNSTLLSFFLIVLSSLCFLAAATSSSQTSNSNTNNIYENNPKSFKICSVLGALELTRLTSSHTRSFFQSAIEDVELVREYLSEAMTNEGIVGGLHDLNEMSRTLDWQLRNLPEGTTTLNASLAWTDDRSDRRIERYVSLANEPYVGSKSADMAMVDAVSNIFPWIVDRKSNEGFWWLDHQNGRSEGPTKPNFRFDKLYVAAWIGTYGEAWMYYPPLRVYGHPFTFPEVLSESYDSHEEEFVRPNLPQHNPTKQAFFTAPYPDTAVPGLSLITAMAPVYYTGQWQGYTYNDTYMASTGVDIAVQSVSTLLEELEGTLTKGSFAFLVDIDFNMVVVSQSTVEKIYPRRTGMEESRVTYDLTDGSIVSDRRNETYLVSDTILQSPLNLTNANWKQLHNDILKVSPGGRGYTQMDITLTTGDSDGPIDFYVAYERWPNVADWVLVTFAPVIQVDHAIDIQLLEDRMDLEFIQQGEGEGSSSLPKEQSGDATDDDSSVSLSDVQSVVLMNKGNLDVSLSMASLPAWIELVDTLPLQQETIKAGSNLTMQFSVSTEELETGITSTLISFNVEDDNYSDCFYSQTIGLEVSVKITAAEELNQLGSVRYVAIALGSLVVATSILCALWVQLNSQAHIVKASQPIFLHMLCLGTLVMGCSIFPLGIDDEHHTTKACDVACMLFPWLFTLGFSIAFSALFAKIWRINQIVRAAKRFKRMRVEARDVMIPFVIIFSLNVILLLVWTLVDPLEYERIETSDNESHGTCFSDPGTASITLMVLITTLNFGAVVLANIQAYQTRDLKVEYSESKYIGIAMGCFLQAFLLGVPLMFLVGENPQAFTFLLSSLCFLIAMSLLMLIFIPKMIYLRKHGADRPADHQQVSKDPRSSQSFSGSFSRVLPSGSRNSNSSNGRAADGLLITSVVVDDSRIEATEEELKAYKDRIRKLQRRLNEAESQLRETGIKTSEFSMVEVEVPLPKVDVASESSSVERTDSSRGTK